MSKYIYIVLNCFVKFNFGFQKWDMAKLKVPADYLVEMQKSRMLACEILSGDEITHFSDIFKNLNKHRSRLLRHERTFVQELDFAEHADERVSESVENHALDIFPKAGGAPKTMDAVLAELATFRLTAMVQKSTARAADAVALASSTVSELQKGHSPNPADAKTSKFRTELLRRCEEFFIMPASTATPAKTGKDSCRAYFVWMRAKAGNGGITIGQYEVWKPYRYLFTKAECAEVFCHIF